MGIPFEFTVVGEPRSQQAHSSGRRHWQQVVRNAAAQSWTASQPTADQVSVTITYYHTRPLIDSPDVDNVPKLILDAMKTLVYEDDRQVTDLICRKRDLNGNLTYQGVSSALLQALSSAQPFVHVLVEDAPNQEVIS